MSGRVNSEEDGLPLPGVNVTLEGMDVGAVTDFDGNYSIEVPEGANILIFSFVGFVS
ncbi:carboxypeptidase-like regulatory domain-containing protein [Christiangramia sp.]|uniref:carboxypeptidase-like regulatory domain-containing protein n=1 Tax=Christiangramia sp. TaxID=1931228 RepID=UPI00261D156F|nr:carboxypeptidase-like regulatory domain-containing protein [Christiangramia sp.]